MRSNQCIVCKRLQEVRTGDWSYLDPSGPFICSKDCIARWIGSHERRVSLHCYTAQVARPSADAVYSEMLGMHFRSRYEVYFAEWLSGTGVAFLYEPFEFHWQGKSYLPDFFFPEHSCFVEVKGVWTASQQTKLKSFREHHPKLPLLTVSWILAGQFYPEEEHNAIC
jgi:hypothetical protein